MLWSLFIYYCADVETGSAWFIFLGKSSKAGFKVVLYVQCTEWSLCLTGEGCPSRTLSVWEGSLDRHWSVCAGWKHCRSAPPPPRAPSPCVCSLWVLAAPYRWTLSAALAAWRIKHKKRWSEIRIPTKYHKNMSSPTRKCVIWNDFQTMTLFLTVNEAQKRLWEECGYLYIWVVVDQWLWHLQRQILVLPPVEHEHNTFLPDDLTQREICGRGEHCNKLKHPTLKYECLSALKA